jgi:hypothetical protein
MFPGVPYMVGDTLAYTVAWPGLLFVTEGLSATLRVLTSCGGRYQYRSVVMGSCLETACTANATLHLA